VIKFQLTYSSQWSIWKITTAVNLFTFQFSRVFFEVPHSGVFSFEFQVFFRNHTLWVCPSSCSFSFRFKSLSWKTLDECASRLARRLLWATSSNKELRWDKLYLAKLSFFGGYQLIKLDTGCLIQWITNLQPALSAFLLFSILAGAVDLLFFSPRLTFTFMFSEQLEILEYHKNSKIS